MTSQAEQREETSSTALRFFRNRKDTARTCMALLFVAVALCSLGFCPTPVRAQPAPYRIWVPVLIYHHVTWFRPTDDATERGLTIQPPQFDAEIRYLATHHFHVLTAAQVVRSLLAHRPLPPHPVVLSFDDGYVDVYANVFRVLERYRMHATFFVCPGLLGKPLGPLKRGYLNWQELEDMSNHGMDIEAHTLTHPDLTRVPAAQVRNEIYGSRHVLRARLHQSVRLFAYPYGDYNAYVLTTLHHAGFIAAFTTHEGYWLSSTQQLELPRVYVENTYTTAVFSDLVTGRCSIYLGRSCG